MISFLFDFRKVVIIILFGSCGCGFLGAIDRDLLFEVIQNGAVQDFKKVITHSIGHASINDGYEYVIELDGKLENVEKFTVFHLAVYLGNVDVIKYLSTVDAVNVNAGFMMTDADGIRMENYTALHLAIHLNKQEIVQILLDDIKTDVDIGYTMLNRYGKKIVNYTALHLAVWLMMLDVVKILLDSGADVKAMRKLIYSNLTTEEYSIFGGLFPKEKIALKKCLLRAVSTNDADEAYYSQFERENEILDFVAKRLLVRQVLLSNFRLLHHERAAFIRSVSSII